MGICIWAVFEDKDFGINETKQVTFGASDLWSIEDAFECAKKLHPKADYYQIGSTNGLGGTTGAERDSMPGY